MKFNLCKLLSEHTKQKENLKFLRLKSNSAYFTLFYFSCYELSQKDTVGILVHVSSCNSTGLGLGNHMLEQWTKGQTQKAPLFGCFLSLCCIWKFTDLRPNT